MSELPELTPDLESGEEGFLIKPEFKPKSIRSFVIRAGRITVGQKNAFDTWWPVFGLSLFKGAIDPEQVFGRKAPLVLEIGFGMGDSLLEMARNEPDKNFIGIEVHPPGVGRLINVAGQENLTNLRVYMADAMDVLEDCIPHGTRKSTTRAGFFSQLLFSNCDLRSRPAAFSTWQPTGRPTLSICWRS